MRLFSILNIAMFAMAAGCVTGEELFEKVVIAHYGNTNTGWHRANGQELENPVEATSESIKSGSELFESLCASCHGNNSPDDGRAAAADPKPPNLAQVAKEKPASYIYLQMSQGRLGMPVWKKHLNETQRWDIVNYLKSLN